MDIYQKAKIYTIRNNVELDEIYVGSTCNKLSTRFGQHKSSSRNKNKSNYKLYAYVDLIGGWDHFYIELHELFPCNSKDELRAREGQIIREIGTLNEKIAGRTIKEYNKQYNPKYYENNKDEIKQKRKQKIICECGSQIRKNDIARHKKTKKHMEFMGI